MGYSIITTLPYPTNKPSNEDINTFKDQFPNVRDYPNGHRIRISDPKPDKINLTIPLVDEVLTDKLAKECPSDMRCERISQVFCSGSANSSIIPSSVRPHFAKPYNRVFEIDFGTPGAVLRCEFRDGKKCGRLLCLSFNPSNVGPNGHKEFAALLFGCSWSAGPAIFKRSTFAQWAKVTRIDCAVDCTGIRPNELVMRHDTVKALTLYSSGSSLETIYLRNASQPDKHALVKAYDKTAEVLLKGGDLSPWPNQVTRIEVTRKGLQQKYLEDVFDLPDAFRKIRCGYAYSQGADCWKRFQAFRCLRQEHGLLGAVELMGLSVDKATALEQLITKVPTPDLVRPKVSWQGWKTGCKKTGIQALLDCPKTPF
ncbi:hypothetical protein [Pontixanthobacter sp. CEM42]|uniref:hypothetical protein n=1 Tax=Pontixanthobacter sp. CEM42 TaxID=2792077 RepID=UPI001ADFF3A8|nr:hypothetical protein [Pontixanthobacter sp. CEM42]